jgi:hypothetical protein
MSTDILLSSNSRIGYSQDVVDLFAKPTGAQHKFRYAKKWISPKVLEQISNKSYRHKNKRALLCYLDQTTESITPQILPVRYATISAVREYGSTISIEFTLGDFCQISDLHAVNASLRASHQGLPAYKEGDIAGSYWLTDDKDSIDGIAKSNELSNWETLVDLYYQTPNAVNEMPFYRFEKIRDLETGMCISPHAHGDGRQFVLGGGKKYIAEVYHYHPKGDFPNCALKVSADDGNLLPLNGDTRALNTRYDDFDYRFRTKRAMLDVDTFLSFRRTEKDSGKLIREDFLLDIKIERSLHLVIAYVGLIAVGFALPFVMSSYIEGKFDWRVFAAALAGGLIVGTATLQKDKVSL